MALSRAEIRELLSLPADERQARLDEWARKRALEQHRRRTRGEQGRLGEEDER